MVNNNNKYKIASIYFIVNFASIIPILITTNLDYNYISIASIVNVISSIIVFRQLRVAYLSFPVIFIVLSTIFHFGEPFLFFIGKQDLINSRNIELCGNSISIYNNANIFALFVQICIVIGFLFSIQNKKILSIISSVESEKSALKFLQKLGIILFILGLFSYTQYYLIQIREIFNGAIYSGIREQDYGPEIIFKDFFQPGLFMLIIGYKNKINVVRLLIVIGIIIEAITMITGNRSQQILTIITLLFIYYRIFSNLTKQKLILYTILTFIISNVLYYISAFRNFGIIEEFEVSSFSDFINFDSFLALIAQLGSNLNVVILTIKDIPTSHPFNCGWTYIISLFSFIPNTGGFLGGIPKQYAFLNFLNTDLPLGGSYIAELFFNFGWFSFPFAILIGYFLGKFHNSFEFSIQMKKWVKFSLYISIFSSLLWWIRDYFSCWILTYVWVSSAIFLFKKFNGIKKFIRSNNEKNISNYSNIRK